MAARGAGGKGLPGARLHLPWRSATRSRRCGWGWYWWPPTRGALRWR